MESGFSMGFSLPRASGHDQPLWSKILMVLAELTRFGRAHRRWFAKGVLITFVVVASRLALPWPLKAVADQWMKRGFTRPGREVLIQLVPAGVDPVVAMGMLFLLLSLVVGLADFLERSWFDRFSQALCNDMEAEATNGAAANPGAARDIATDSERLKSGLSGFMVQVATNGLVFAGVAAVLITMAPSVGLVFAIAGVLTATVTGGAAVMIFGDSLTSRGARRSGLSGTSHRHHHLKQPETRSTLLQGAATWVAHGIFGLAVLLALLIAAQAANTGRISAGDVVIFMMYTLMMRGPIIRLARQGAKSGKILAAAYHLLEIDKLGNQTRHGSAA